MKRTVLLVGALWLAAEALFAQATLATYQFDVGQTTFGLALPQGAATAGVKVGTLSTQTDVKTRWSDGSIKFAIVSAAIPSTGSYAITAGPASGTAFTPTWPSASVRFTIGDTTYVADLPVFSGSDCWLTGQIVRECRAIVAPLTHPLLQVVYDVRSYANGAHRLDVTVQNVKDTAGGGSVAYDVAIVANGATVYQRAAVTQPYFTRWRKAFAVGGLVESSSVPDLAPFVASKFLPSFLSSVTNQVYGDLSEPRFDILGFGDMSQDMTGPGGRPEIGFYPYWTVQYLAHRSPSQRAYMLRSADLSGSWSGHITEPDGKTLISLDTYPNFWFDWRSVGRPNGAHSYAGMTNQMENAHLSSLTYVPYLLTGDRYYLDQLKLWANFAMIWTWPDNTSWPREGSKGILIGNQIRGIAWGLRALAEAAAAVPDGDPEKDYFASRVTHNLTALNAYSQNPAKQSEFGTLDLVFAGKWPERETFGAQGVPGSVWTPPWQFAYLAWVLDRVPEMGSWGNANHLRDRLIRVYWRLFTSGTDYPREYNAPYGIFTHTVVENPVGVYTYTPKNTMAELFAGSFGTPPRNPDPIVGYYGPEGRAALVLAEKIGLSGSAAARTWLEGLTGVMDDVRARSGFAIAVSAPAPPPSTLLPPESFRIIRGDQ